MIFNQEVNGIYLACLSRSNKFYHRRKYSYMRMPGYKKIIVHTHDLKYHICCNLHADILSIYNMLPSF